MKVAKLQSCIKVCISYYLSRTLVLFFINYYLIYIVYKEISTFHIYYSVYVQLCNFATNRCKTLIFNN